MTTNHKGYTATETVPEYLIRIGRAGGKSRSAAKAAAARRNGRKNKARKEPAMILERIAFK